MPGKKKEEVEAVENLVAETAEAPVKKTRKPRAKKEAVAEVTAPVEKPACNPALPARKQLFRTLSSRTALMTASHMHL